MNDDPSPLRLLLDPRGRIARRTYWIWGVVVISALSLLLRALLDIARIGADNADAAVSLVFMWPAIAVSIKRWHDRDKSGWWVLVALIPVVGWIWMLVDNGFLRGTRGANRYGADPVAADSWL